MKVRFWPSLWGGRRCLPLAADAALKGASIDSTTASGKLVIGIFAAPAEFERELISDAPSPASPPVPGDGRAGPTR